MPEAMERALRAQAKKKGFDKERTDRYVYGGMRKAGWEPGEGEGHKKKRAKRKKHAKREPY